MRFVQFLLNEAAAPGSQMKIQELDTVEETVRLLQTKCRNNSARFFDQTEERRMQIWRGGGRITRSPMATTDPSASSRQSENTSNYYTVILDNLPSRSHFPKRSRSLVAVNDYEIAHAFGSVVRVIPYDNTPIGVVNTPDLWNGRIGDEGIQGLNGLWEDLFRRLSISTGTPAPTSSDLTWQDFLKIDDADEPMKDAFAALLNEYGVIDAAAVFRTKGIVAALEQMYGKMLEPAHTMVTNTDDLPPTKTEVWIGGPVVLIRSDMIDDVIDYARESAPK